MRYRHSFNVELPIFIESQHRDFEDAFDEWANSFSGIEELRKHLTSTTEKTGDLVKSVRWWATNTVPPLH